MLLDVRISEVPPTRARDHLEHPLPALALREMHHAAEQAAIGSDAEERRRQNLVEMRVARGVVFEDDIARLPRVGVAQVRLEAALPVGMTERDRARGEHQLARDEKIVRDRVGGEVGEVPETEGPQRIARREVEDLLAPVPRVAMPADRSVLLRHRCVGRDVAVEKIVRERAQQIGDDGRELVQVREHRFTQEDVGAGRPGVRDSREEHRCDDGQEGGRGQSLHPRFLPFSNLRLHFHTESPRRTSRSVAAASMAVSSSSCCMTSVSASRSVSRSSALSAARTMRCRTSRDAPTRASASVLIEPISWRTSSIAGPAKPLRAFTAARTPSAAALIPTAATSAAIAMMARLIADTTPTHVGSITKPLLTVAMLSTGAPTRVPPRP